MKRLLFTIAAIVTLATAAFGHDEPPTFTQELYNQATADNDPAAQWAVGECYALGRGVARNSDTALQWFKRAAAQDPVYINSIANSFENGIYLTQNYDSAFHYYQLGAQRGDFVSIWNIGEFYAHGYSVPRDTVQALQWFQRAAQIDPSYCWALGENYLAGDAVPRDTALAIQHFERAASQEGYLALILADRYHKGTDIPQDLNAAFRCLHAAATRENYTPAQWEVAEYYANGIGVQANPDSALYWFQRAAADDRYYMWQLGERLATGNGVKKDPNLALQCFQQAADGNEFFQLKLAQCYETGQFVPKDKTKATHWRQQAQQTKSKTE